LQNLTAAQKVNTRICFAEGSAYGPQWWSWWCSSDPTLCR